MLGCYTIGLLLTLLPARLRRRWFAQWEQDLKSSAFVSGIVQMFGCLALLFVGYPRFMRAQMADASTVGVARAAETMGQTALMTFGGILGLAYLIQPLSLLLIYFVIEGVVRWGAVVVSGEIVATLPLYVADWVVLKFQDRARESALGPIIPDELTRTPEGEDDCPLRIASCRPKQWTPLTTIEFEEHLYEVANEMAANPPRPFVYLLRPAPLSKVVRGIHHYDPDELLVQHGISKAAAAARS